MVRKYLTDVAIEIQSVDADFTNNSIYNSVDNS